ncbi:hypothetical protein JCM10908_005892 [Rhodotorula pacifica]|uniref:uncharacterized protein n=1 Tax=Rhodotorula pacifica TaxID=1495444 RepID=UPI00317D66A5
MSMTMPASQIETDPSTMPTKSTMLEPAAWVASLGSLPEEIKILIAKMLSKRTEKPSVEYYYAEDVQSYQSSELKHLGRVNREWRQICKSLLSQHLTLKTSTVTEVAASCASVAITTVSIELDATPLEAVTAIRHILDACPNIDTLSLNFVSQQLNVVAEQQVAATIGTWLDARSRGLKSSTSVRQVFSQHACEALAHVHGVKDFTTDSGIPNQYLSSLNLTKDWPLESLALLPPDGCETRSDDLIPLIQFHANTLTSLRIEDEIDGGELRAKESTLKRSIERPHLIKLELVVTVPSMAFNPTGEPYTTFLDLLHPATPIEFLRFHINADSIVSLCDFVKEQEPKRLKRIEWCVRVRAKWYMGELPDEDQWEELRSLCKEKGIELMDQDCVEYTR